MNYEQIIRDTVTAAAPNDPMNYVMQVVRPLAMNAMEHSIKECDYCPIAQQGRCVKTIPKGTENASILVIGDFPTKEQWKNENTIQHVYEDTPEWTKIIKKIIDAYHINEKSLFFINAVNCCPTKKIQDEYIYRQPNSNEINGCKPFIDYAFKIVDPILIILLGNFALNAVREDVSIIKSRGEFINVKGVKAMPTYSPTHLLQLEEMKDKSIVEEYKADFCDDIFRAFLWVQEEYPDNNILLEKLQ